MGPRFVLHKKARQLLWYLPIEALSECTTPIFGRNSIQWIGVTGIPFSMILVEKSSLPSNNSVKTFYAAKNWSMTCTQVPRQHSVLSVVFHLVQLEVANDSISHD